MKALMLMSLALAACQTQKGPVADLVLMNGHIITMDEGAPEAQAIAVAGDRILAVGTDAAIESHIGDSTEVVDLEGKTVIPGMIDSHVHFIGLGNRLLQLDARNVRDQDEIIERVAEQAKNVEPGEWIQGRGWDQNRWTVKEFPPEEELDAVSPENPVYLRRVDGHAAWVNSRASRSRTSPETLPIRRAGASFATLAASPRARSSTTPSASSHNTFHRYRRSRSDAPSASRSKNVCHRMRNYGPACASGASPARMRRRHPGRTSEERVSTKQ